MQQLESLAQGDATPADALRLVEGLPPEHEADALELYMAFRAWTWKALDQRRRDAELREWHDVMRSAQARVRNFTRVHAQLEVLVDLIGESVAVAARDTAGTALRMRHVRETLAAIRDARGGSLRKHEVMDALGIKAANATRLMNMMTSAGLVERTMDGREAVYRLSRAGLGHAHNQQEAHAAKGGAEALRLSLDAMIKEFATEALHDHDFGLKMFGFPAYKAIDEFTSKSQNWLNSNDLRVIERPTTPDIHDKVFILLAPMHGGGGRWPHRSGMGAGTGKLRAHG